MGLFDFLNRIRQEAASSVEKQQKIGRLDSINSLISITVTLYILITTAPNVCVDGHIFNEKLFPILVKYYMFAIICLILCYFCSHALKSWDIVGIKYEKTLIFYSNLLILVNLGLLGSLLIVLIDPLSFFQEIRVIVFVTSLLVTLNVVLPTVSLTLLGGVLFYKFLDYVFGSWIERKQL